MTMDKLLRIEVFKANTYLSTLRHLASMIGGDHGRLIVCNIRDADDKIEEYEKYLNAH